MDHMTHQAQLGKYTQRKSGQSSLIPKCCVQTELLFAPAEDVEVDVESIVFDCVDSEGLSMPHTDADHCYSSNDKSWL